jgi:EAL domain-containing protein (putative c-di-GMP-specific phosphodiesterase class I)
MHIEAVAAVGHDTVNRPAVPTIATIIADRAFVMAFQPIMELPSLRTIGVEALARFLVEPLRGPRPWFAAAEAVGLGTELELATARAALSRLADLPPSVHMAVNVSPDTMSSPGLLALLDAVPEGRLVMEVTEHAAVEDYATLRSAFRDVQARGVRLAIDDVGAGFSSLQHLMRLTPDFIKLDLSITQHSTDAGGRALIGGLVAYAEAVGATVIAEGIETADQLGALRASGVHLGQGYLLARPAYLPRANGLRQRAG